MENTGIERIYFDLADNLINVVLRNTGTKDMPDRAAIAQWIKDNMPQRKGQITDEELDRKADKFVADNYDKIGELYMNEGMKACYKAGFREEA